MAVTIGCGGSVDDSTSQTAAAECPGIGVLPDRANEFELQWGATNSNAALGSGALTATLSRCGEITSLKWPGPSYYDQLDYLTSNAPDARLLPHFGAFASNGAFPGLAYETASGRAVTWLRSGEWSHEQTYTTDTSDVAVTTMLNFRLGLTVRAWQFVNPDANVLVNHYEVERSPQSPVTDASLIFYSNFAPTLSRRALFQVADWAVDFQNDHAVVYDRQEHAILHYLPDSARRTPHALPEVSEILRTPGDAASLAAKVDALIASLTEPGVYVALGARGGDDSHQCGFDDVDLCNFQSVLTEGTIRAFNLGDTFGEFVRQAFQCARLITNPRGPLAQCRDDLGWTYNAESAYSDAADGQLSGSPIAACQANAALSRHLTFTQNRAAATFDIGIGASRDEAYRLLREARAGDVGRQRADTEAWWDAYLAPARLPQTDDPEILTFAKRSLVVARTATDNASGAIVASVNTQPPYGADWVRDGAFINYALDLAGYPEVVSRHNRFYARVQRKRPAPWSALYDFGTCDPAQPVYPNCIPAGTYEGNYYADPTLAVPALAVSFEIDEASLGVWTMWEHAKYLTDPTERTAYLADVCPSIELGARNLAACKDEANDLQCVANEDDVIEPTQGLLGAQTVLLALRSATQAAAACGFATVDVDAWQVRAGELERAIRANFYREQPSPHFEGSRSGWLIWPVQYLDPDDGLTTAHANLLRARDIDPIVQRTAPDGAYNAETLLVLVELARARGDAEKLHELQQTVGFFIHNLTTVGTHHMSEEYGRVPVDLNGDGIAPDYWPQNDVPHVWEHSYLYAAAMRAFGGGVEPATN